jgi:hypothetical protein
MRGVQIKGGSRVCRGQVNQPFPITGPQITLPSHRHFRCDRAVTGENAFGQKIIGSTPASTSSVPRSRSKLSTRFKPRILKESPDGNTWCEERT